MMHVAERIIDESRSLETGEMTAAARRALMTITARPDDGVPSWLRQVFQKEFRLSWSDHLPIVLTITMPLAGGGGVAESKDAEPGDR